MSNLTSWRELSVDDLCLRVTSGGTPKRTVPEYYSPATIPWVKTGDLLDTYVSSYSEYISDRGLQESSAKILPADTVLMAMYGATVGALGILSEEATCNQASCALITDPEVCNPRWLFYALLNGRNYIVSQATGAAQQNLSGKTIRQFRFLTPPISEQRAIAEVLGALDDKIAANNRAFRIVEYLGVAKFTQLGLDEESQNAPVPFADFFEVNPRRTVTSDAPITVNMQALPTTGPLINSWSRGKRKGGARFTNGDTLLARITPCLENRKTAYVDFLNADEVGIGSTEFIVLRSKEGLPLGLSYFMAISSRFRDFAIQNMVGTSGRQRVSAQDLERYSLSPIDRSHLQEFGEWADINLAYLGSLRDENNALSATRDALLPQLMSGKLRVRDAEAVVEDVL